MRILRVGIHNLNSLSGHQEIDFRSEPLRSAGLYAIVGPTGAGKSTILDAITLALYGKTERDDTGSEVMTHGTGECFAEVEFETDAGRYLSRWERRRARNKPDGNLQTASRLLQQWDDRGEEYRTISDSKLREVDRKTTEVVGLDYNRFVRSVMLTQGQFARFLNSDVSDRADVLEKITGTEIYRDLSRAAFERHKIAREAHDRLVADREAATALGEEDRRALEEAIRESQRQILHLRPRQQELAGQQNLYAEADKLRATAETTRSELAAARAEEEQTRASRTALTESVRLQPLREPLREVTTLRAQLAAEQQLLTGDSARVLAATTAGERAAAMLSEQTAKLVAFEQQKPEKEAKLARAEAVEASLTVVSRDVATATQQRQDQQTRLSATRRELQTLEQQSAPLTAQLAGRDAGQLEAAVTAAEEQLVTQRRALTLQEQWAKHAVLARQLAQAETLVAQLTTVREAGSKHAATTAKDLQTARENVASRTRLLRAAEQQRGLDPYKETLVAGDPCPVCGATDHPALAHYVPVSDGDLARCHRDLAEAEEALATARTAERAAELALTKTDSELAGARTQVQRLQQEVGSARPAGKPVKPDVAGLGATIAGLEQELVRLRGQRSAATRLLQLTPKIDALTARTKELEREGAATDERLVGLTAELTKLQAEKQALIGALTVARCRAILTDRERFVRAEVDGSRTAREEAAAALAGATAQESVRKRQVQEITDKLTVATAALMTRFETFGLADETAALARLLDPAEEERRRTTLGQLDQRLATLTDRAAREAAQLTELDGKLAGLPTAAVLAEEAASLLTTISAADQELGRLRERLERDDAVRTKNAALAEQLTAVTRELERWARLNDLIGQQSGVKFSRFAQTLTLRQLTEVGNRHLARISDRYRMRHRAADDLTREQLELEIIDGYQNDNARPMATLSGGETFLVSLALALGLSELASGRADIRSLFIDEGFGTLDDQILDKAITALERLEGQGKTIGLISHVRELRERIHCQVRLEAVGNGLSRLSVVGG